MTANRWSRAKAESSEDMFDAIWLVLTLGLFGVGLAYLAACDRV
ncbi:hypothetical protein [Aliidongia dinghuensis]|nr:hypothetical protein [Aliidongia dinghuensis]